MTLTPKWLLKKSKVPKRKILTIYKSSKKMILKEAFYMKDQYPNIILNRKKSLKKTHKKVL